MQAVFVCGGRGTRLRPELAGPKSLTSIGGAPLIERLAAQIVPIHHSTKPPVVIVDESDRQTPKAARRLLPSATIVGQGHPDGVANALLLALPFLDDMIIVTLGDVFLDGSLATIQRAPGLLFWREAPAEETRKNFGIATTTEGIVSTVAEKPVDSIGLLCGMGVYILSRSIVSGFVDAPVDARTGERGITMAIAAAVASGVTFRTFSFSGYYNNINSPGDVIAVERRVGRSDARA